MLGSTVIPAPQRFQQEIGRSFTGTEDAPVGSVHLIHSTPVGVWAFAAGQWHVFRDGRWQRMPRLEGFVLPASSGQPIHVSVPAGEVRQILRVGTTNWVAATSKCFVVPDRGGQATVIAWPQDFILQQAAVSPDGTLHAAGSTGLFALRHSGWTPVEIVDDAGRAWTAGGVLGVAFDAKGQLWFATKAGVGVRTFGNKRVSEPPDGRVPIGNLQTPGETWQFFEGKDGLPWNDFTGIFQGRDGEVWFTTHLGVIRFDGKAFHYRQGPRWLPHDDVAQAALDADGNLWFATANGVGCIERRPMTLAEKAAFYEGEIERYIKRTPFGYVSGAPLSKTADKATANPQDSDNDGLWTAMYGAGECFAYAATKDPKAKARAKQAFEALRFLQKVTQGCDHAPPKGYIARTICPAEWPDPNIGRLEADRRKTSEDALWKVYEPRWPRSADGKWFWKSDTSSDELDGHYFFYPLYYDFCADTEPERERVREVVRDITDHLVDHGFLLIDHDGKPTRWGVYAPKYLNHDPSWWQERGLKSLSILSYLAVAGHVTGDPKYEKAVRELIDREGYAHNAMHPKVQNGPGSGNQSDDEMAFMCYYGLLRYSRDEPLKNLIRYSFYRYWLNEASEGNPFFNFAYAGLNLDATSSSPWGAFPVKPWAGWHEDAMAALYGFPLDRLNWPLRNSHRLDVQFLPHARGGDIERPDEPHRRGHLASGKVLPVENRHFNHWNTDPWDLDYGGNGKELGPGTVFLLPYYMGLYHGFIAKQ